MSDFSPPPLSDLSPLTDFPPPINGFNTGGEDTEEEDGDYNFVLGDNQYDLTGLSDKINRLELEKMKSLPPREILELQRESQSGGVFPSTDEVSDQSQEESDSPAESSVEPSEAKQVIAMTSQELENIEPSADHDQQHDHHTDHHDHHEHRDHHVQHDQVCDPSVADDGTADQVLSSSQSSHDNNLETLQVAVEEENSEVGETLALEGEPEHPSEVDPAKDDHEVIDLDLGTEEDLTGDTEDVAEVEAGWGEFPENDSGCQGAGEAWGNFPADEWSLPTEANQEDRDDFQFDESEDDDFGDFGEAPELVQNNEVKEESRILFDLSELRNKTCSLLESVYGLSSGGEPPGNCEEEFKNNLEVTVLSEGQIFEKIDNPASAPALNHQWRDSLTYSSLLLTLGIDSSSNVGRQKCIL